VQVRGHEQADAGVRIAPGCGAEPARDHSMSDRLLDLHPGLLAFCDAATIARGLQPEKGKRHQNINGTERS
jgi:hypothetical protein